MKKSLIFLAFFVAISFTGCKTVSPQKSVSTAPVTATAKRTSSAAVQSSDAKMSVSYELEATNTCNDKETFDCNINMKVLGDSFDGVVIKSGIPDGVEYVCSGIEQGDIKNGYYYITDDTKYSSDFDPALGYKIQVKFPQTYSIPFYFYKSDGKTPVVDENGKPLALTVTIKATGKL